MSPALITEETLDACCRPLSRHRGSHGPHDRALPLYLAVAQTPSDPADLVLAAAREALGGRERLTAEKLRRHRRTRQVQGNNLVAIEFQIDVGIGFQF